MLEIFEIIKVWMWKLQCDTEQKCNCSSHILLEKHHLLDCRNLTVYYISKFPGGLCRNLGIILLKIQDKINQRAPKGDPKNESGNSSKKP